MNGSRLAWNTAFPLVASVLLIEGLTRQTAPLSAGLVILGAMGFLMFPALSFCGVVVRDTGRAGIGTRIKHCGGALASTTRRT